MSQNDILFSRGVANATIVASGTKIAVGVVSNPLTVSLATADFQIFGSTGLIIPTNPSSAVASIVEGTVRFNTTSKRLEVDNGSSWDPISVTNDLPSTAFSYIEGTTYVVNKDLAVIPGIANPSTASLISVAIDIQDTEPTIVLRNLSSATGNSAIYMTGGTGNTNPAAVNGFQIKTITGDSSIYDSSLEINPIIQSDLSTTMNSITLTPYGMEIAPAVISITGSGFAQPTLKIRGSAHTTETALYVNKEDVPGVLPASSQTDSNKIASFNYATDSVLDILGSGKLWVNGSSGAVLAVKAVNLSNPGYLAKFEPGDYSGTNLEGILIDISTSTPSGTIALFNSGGSQKVKIDGTGNTTISGTLTSLKTLTSVISAPSYSIPSTDSKILFYNNTVNNWSGTGVDSAGHWWLRTGTTSANYLVMQSDGNVGIGTNISKTKLDVNGSLTILNRSDFPALNTTGGTLYPSRINMGNTDTLYGPIIRSSYENTSFTDQVDLQFLTSPASNSVATVAMVVKSLGGNVGIGTSSPTAKLEVVGTTKLSTAIINELSATGNATVGVLRATSANITTATVNTLNVTGSFNLTASGLLPTGMIIMWPNTSPPSGWELCLGQPIPSTTPYEAIRALLGSPYNFPNLSQRFPLGGGSANPSLTTRTYGQTGGAETHTLTTAEMPAHTHTVVTLKGGYSGPTDVAAFSDTSAGTTQTSSSTGGGGAHNNMPPFFVVYFIIKL